MDWLFLVALGIMWTAFLLPSDRRKASPGQSVRDFERNMDLLAKTDGNIQGRWIITPRKGTPFLGDRGRAQARARARRRKVFEVLLEAIFFSFLIGLVPPLRVMWTFGAVGIGLLAVYVWMLISIKERSSQSRVRQVARDSLAPARPTAPTRVAHGQQRYVAEGRSRHARPSFNGLGAIAGDELTRIVVRRRDVEIARA